MRWFNCANVWKRFTRNFKEREENMKGRWILKGMKIALLVLLAAAVMSFVVMSLWNWLMPGLFALHRINFWQALGLLILGKILFGGFRGPRGPHMHWRGRMMERWEKMTPEEREKFREGMKGRCGPFGARTVEPKA
jgi:Ca2+/H+ antiporter, TMEM165/GDT1 family